MTYELSKAAEMALEALDAITYRIERDLEHDHEWAVIERELASEAVTALRQALAEPEQEPVAWHEPGSFGHVTIVKKWALENGWEPLYTAPPKQWVKLTDEEIQKLQHQNWEERWLYVEFARAIEAKLKEKNGG